MLALPILPIVDLDIADGLPRAATVPHRHGQPHGAFWALDAVAVAPALLVELHVVVVHEHVGLAHEIEIAEPRQISRLQHDECRHEAMPSWMRGQKHCTDSVSRARRDRSSTHFANGRDVRDRWFYRAQR